MGKDIATTALGADLLCEGDKSFDGAMANNGSVESSVFMVAQTMGSQQINVLVSGGGYVYQGQATTITIEVGPDADNVTTTQVEEILPSGNVAVGDYLFQYVMPRDVEDMYTKVTVASASNHSGTDIQVYVVGVA